MDGDKYMMETSYYHEATDNVSTAFVREISKDEYKEPVVAAVPVVESVDTTVTTSKGKK
jgi:hypothetical protein